MMVLRTALTIVKGGAIFIITGRTKECCSSGSDSAAQAQAEERKSKIQGHSGMDSKTISKQSQKSQLLIINKIY